MLRRHLCYSSSSLHPSLTMITRHRFGGCLFSSSIFTTTVSFRKSSSSTTTTIPEEPELLTVDEIEVVTDDNNNSDGDHHLDASHLLKTKFADENNNMNQDSSSSSSSTTTLTSFEDVKTIDTYSRGKVANFLKKQKKYSATLCKTIFSTTTASHQEENDGDGDDPANKIIFAKFRMILPPPFDDEKKTMTIFAEGCASDEKTAESCAMMHAERIIDFLRIPICSLSGAQKRHAANAKAQGRTAPPDTNSSWAPLTMEDIKTEKYGRLPSPIRFLDSHMTRVYGNAGVGMSMAGSSASSGGDSSSSYYQTVYSTPTDFFPSPDAIREIRFVDSGSVNRVRSFFYLTNRQVPLQKMSRIVRVFVPSSSSGKGVEEEFVAQIKLTKILPQPDCGVRIAIGRASDKKTAFVLAAMHAELIIDTLGISLFPNDIQRQTLHAIECESQKRFAPHPGVDYKDRRQYQSPPGMYYKGDASKQQIQKILKEHSSMFSSGNNIDTKNNKNSSNNAASNKEDHHHNHHQLVDPATLLPPNVDTLDYVPGNECLKFLDAFFVDYRIQRDKTVKQQKQSQNSSLKVEEEASSKSSLSSNGHHHAEDSMKRFSIRPINRISYVATILIPMSHYEMKDRIARGVGETENDAKAAACAHALHILGTLGVPVFPNDKEQQQKVADTLRQFGIKVAEPGEAAVTGVVSMSSPSSSSLSQAASPPSIRIRPHEESNGGMKIFAHEFQSYQNSLKNQSGSDHHHSSSDIFAAFDEAVAECNNNNSSEGNKNNNANNNSNDNTEDSTTTTSKTKTSTTAVSLQEQKLERMRSSQPKELWSLEPDEEETLNSTPYILVHPNSREFHHKNNTASNFFTRSIMSPRRIDIPSRARILNYLARHGITGERAFICTPFNNREDQRRFRCQIQLPVPGVFGARIAVGEASTSKEAEIVASMHAELIIDTLGIPLFDNPVLQKSHADFARSQGRYANPTTRIIEATATVDSTTIPSPPALRKETADSLTWRNYLRRQQSSASSSTAATNNNQSKNSNDTTNNNNNTSNKNLQKQQQQQPISDLDQFENIYAEDLKKNSFLRQRMLDYLRKVTNGQMDMNDIIVSPFVASSSTSTTSNDHQSSSSSSTTGGLFHARFLVPFPSNNNNHNSNHNQQQQRRIFAQGVSEKRDQAILLSMLHCELILDACNVCIHQNDDQKQYAHYYHVMKMKNELAPGAGEENATDDTNSSVFEVSSVFHRRTAPRPGTFPIDQDAPLLFEVPAGLKCDGGPPFPRPPAVPFHLFESMPHHHQPTTMESLQQRRDELDHFVSSQWATYCQKVEYTLGERAKLKRLRQVAARSAPQSGDEMVDNCLMLAEKAEFHHTAAIDLAARLRERGMPPSLQWKHLNLSAGHDRNIVLSIAELVPFPVKVVGVGPNSHASQIRASMHALQILTRHVPVLPYSSSASSTTATSAATPIQQQPQNINMKPQQPESSNKNRPIRQQAHPRAASSSSSSSSQHQNKLDAISPTYSYRMLQLLSIVVKSKPLSLRVKDSNANNFSSTSSSSSATMTGIAELELLDGSRLVGRNEQLCLRLDSFAKNQSEENFNRRQKTLEKALQQAVKDLFRICGQKMSAVLPLERVVKTFPVVWQWDTVPVGFIIRMGNTMTKLIDDRYEDVVVNNTVDNNHNNTSHDNYYSGENNNINNHSSFISSTWLESDVFENNNNNSHHQSRFQQQQHHHHPTKQKQQLQQLLTSQLNEIQTLMINQKQNKENLEKKIAKQINNNNNNNSKKFGALLISSSSSTNLLASGRSTQLPQIVCSILKKERTQDIVEPRVLIVAKSTSSAAMLVDYYAKKNDNDQQEQQQDNNRSSSNFFLPFSVGGSPLATSSSLLFSSSSSFSSSAAASSHCLVCTESEFIHWVVSNNNNNNHHHQSSSSSLHLLPHAIIFEDVNPLSDYENEKIKNLMSAVDSTAKSQDTPAPSYFVTSNVATPTDILLENRPKLQSIYNDFVLLMNNTNTSDEHNDKQRSSSSNNMPVIVSCSISEIASQLTTALMNSNNNTNKRSNTNNNSNVIIIEAPTSETVRHLSSLLRSPESRIPLSSTTRILPPIHSFSSTTSILSVMKEVFGANNKGENSTTTTTTTTSNLILIIDKELSTWLPIGSNHHQHQIIRVTTTTTTNEDGKKDSLIATTSSSITQQLSSLLLSSSSDANKNNSFELFSYLLSNSHSFSFSPENNTDHHNHYPLDIRISKLLLASMMFRCFDDGLTCAAILHLYFSSSSQKQQQQQREKTILFPSGSEDDLFGSAVSKYREWSRGGSTTNTATDDSFTSSPSSTPLFEDVMKKIAITKWQLRQKLVELGIAPVRGGHKNAETSSFVDDHPQLNFFFKDASYSNSKHPNAQKSHLMKQVALLKMAFGIANSSNSLWCMSQPNSESAIETAAAKLSRGGKIGGVNKNNNDDSSVQTSWERKSSMSQNSNLEHHRFRFGYQIISMTDDASSSSSSSSSSAKNTTTNDKDFMQNLSSQQQQQNAANLRSNNNSMKNRRNNNSNSDAHDDDDWKDADEFLGREFSSTNVKSSGVQAAAAMLNSHDVEIVSLSSDGKDGTIGKNFSIAGSFESGDEDRDDSRSTNHSNNNNRKSQQQNQSQQLLLKDAPFIASFSSSVDDHLPAVKLSPWHVLFCSSPSSLSFPVDECGIVMVDNKFVFSSGADLPTIPAFRKLHQDCWRTIMATDYTVFSSLLENSCGSDVEHGNNNSNSVHHQHPMSDLTLDLIITLCNKKMTSVVNEYGRQANFYEEVL